MSRTPSPAPDTASPADHTEHSLRSDKSGSPQVASEKEREHSEVPQGSKSKSPDDASAEASTSPSPISASDSASASASASAPASSSASPPASVSAAPPSSWQAVWSPAHNAYYFYNSVTHDTTWVNPLQPNAEAGPSNTSEALSSIDDAAQQVTSGYDLYTAAVTQGIDPALAHLDPSLVGSSTNPASFTYTAKFNARTGAFTRPDGRDPTHLSEYERAKRMSEFYFDVNAWEDEVAQRNLEEAQEEEGKKRKRPTKKDLERFREQKRQKKLAKTAWLRT